MWIRSQDKKKLKEIHDVSIYHDTKIWADCSFIGEYSTKEKALKVLDEIQSVIEDKQFRTIDNVGCGDYVLHNGVQIYEMPQNEDVEI